MGLTGTLRIVASRKCAQCNTEYGAHSKKRFMKCLYTANYNLYNVLLELNELKRTTPEPVTEVKNDS